ncbi:MAG: response regulator [Vicinamibacterales bacterium]
MGTRLRVLLVDDEAPMRVLMRRFLDLDFELDVIEADDGTTALEVLLNEPVDVVMLDLRMRVMGGIDALKAIRRTPRLASLPVVFVTGVADEEAVSIAVSLGVQAIVVKPFTRESLRDRTQTLLGGAIKTPPSAASRRRSTQKMIDLAPTQSVLVVDRELEYRSVLSTLLARIAKVAEAPNEFAALTLCLEGPCPDAIVFGQLSEFSPLDGCAQKVREITTGKPLALVAAAPAEQVGPLRAKGLFDAVMVRRCDAEFTTDSLLDVLSERSAERLLLHTSATDIVEALDWTRQEMTRVSGLALREAPAGMAAEARGVRAQVELHSAHATYRLRLFVPMPLALGIAARNTNVEADALSDVELSGVVSNLLADSARHLQQRLAARPCTVEIGAIQAAVADTLGETLGSAAEQRGTRRWLAPEATCPVVFTLAPGVGA